MNLFVCLWNAPEAWRLAALDAVKRMSDVLPQLSADSARQAYPPTHGAAGTYAHPVVATIQTADAALGERRYVAMDGPDLVLYKTVHPSIPRVKSPCGRPARSLVDGKRCRTIWKGSLSSFGLRLGRSRCSPTPLASTLSTTGSGIGYGSSATASQSFAPLQPSGVGTLSASARRPSPAGGGRP